MTTFLLVRHATTDWVGRGLSGRTPGVSLSPAGRVEAEALAERLAPVRIAAVYSSPLERAMETAEMVARRHGLAVHRRSGLQEIDFGEWTGRDFDLLRSDPRWTRFNTHRATAEVPGGEGMARVQARIGAELDGLAERHPAECVVAVSHADVIRAAVLGVLGLSLDHFGRLEVWPASVTVLERDAAGSRLVRLNDTGPLAAAS
jgi:probable phosphomutase (TIGR03848 family)